MSTTQRDWLDSRGNFLFGKYKGDPAEEVAQEDPSYIKWIIEKVDDCSDEDKEVLSSCLQFRSRSRRHTR